MKSEAEVLGMVKILEQKANELCLKIGRPNLEDDMRMSGIPILMARENALREQVKILQWLLRD